MRVGPDGNSLAGDAILIVDTVKHADPSAHPPAHLADKAILHATQEPVVTRAGQLWEVAETLRPSFAAQGRTV